MSTRYRALRGRMPSRPRHGICENPSVLTPAPVPLPALGGPGQVVAR
ncbi:hypothetical protein [Cellulomonas sp. 73-145]|nr:hypothetical protein [Cellulomonas sp. 73-145]MBN9327884.1 hypothetical protein [Cellulomonas sp.]